MQVSDILATKQNGVITARPYERIDTLAHRLRNEKIGAVIVSGDDDTMMGIISERDVVRGLAEYGPEVLSLTVSALMTQNVRTCTPREGVKEVMSKMTLHRIRHLPVVEGGRIVGMVSIGDVLKSRLEDMAMEANVLRDIAIAARH